MKTKKTGDVYELLCDCGEEVSGYDKASVEETFARHEAKKHPKKKAKA